MSETSTTTTAEPKASLTTTVPWGRMVSLALALYSLDQITKWSVVTNIHKGEFVPVIKGFFALTQAHNTGMAWGLGQGNNGVFVGLCVATLIALVLLTAKGAFICKWTRTGVSLLMAGVAGNLTDRIVHGHVIDFLDFTFSWGDWSYGYPTFNVADICIVSAAVLFVIGSFFTSQGEEKKASINEKSA